MRRWIRSLIVALLCLTLFVDTAKACWFLRRRSQACRPVACRPICPPPCFVPSETVDVVSGDVVEDHIAAAPTPAADHPVAATPPAPPRETVVEHGATVVIAPQPAAAAPTRAADSIVTAPAEKQPAPTAEPMPLESATPAAPQPETAAAREPLPDLKPALPAGPAMVAPASNDEPVVEPTPGTDSQATLATAPAKDDAAEAAEAAPAVADKPMPAETAPASDLAGGPETKARSSEPREPNLFDLYGDEDEDAMPAEDETRSADEPADSEEPDMTDDDAEAGADDASESDTPADDAEEAEEMAEDDSAEDASADDENAPAEPAEDEAKDAAEATDAQPEAKPDAAETDPFAATFAVPDEPMRRWTDETGSRHVQGWLVELHGDHVRILKANGRHTTVPVKALSAADRDYVSAVGDRLAAERKGQGPAATSTAGL